MTANRFWGALAALLALGLSTSIAGMAAAATEVTRTSSPVRVDGVLEEPAWEGATAIELPYEWFPGENVPAPVSTTALVTYDAEHLYVAFRAADPDPSRIRARFADRDA